jgi:hypothetical protein
MMAKALIVLDLRQNLRRNRDKDFRLREVEVSTTLVKFMETHSLFTRKILQPNDELKKDTRITEDDLTLEGKAFFWGPFIDKWYDGHDKGTKISYTKSLERGLEKILTMGAVEFLKTTRYFLYHNPPEVLH